MIGVLVEGNWLNPNATRQFQLKELHRLPITRGCWEFGKDILGDESALDLLLILASIKVDLALVHFQLINYIDLIN